MAENPQNFNERISSELNNPYSFAASKTIKQYSGSDLRMETYASLEKRDEIYKNFIARTYGSYDNFLQQNKLNQSLSVFDPSKDYIIDVTVIKEDAAYKTDHISAQETILENLSGVCTVYFTKVNGSTSKLICTLDSEYIPNSQWPTRASFFTPMARDRVGVWDINEQKWKSFYMSKVFKFIRDDTQSIE